VRCPGINRLLVFVAVAGVILFHSVAFAQVKGQLTSDLTVGAAHDVQLKSGQVVQVLKSSGGTAVIMVAMPDGSNGVFQVDASAVEVQAASAPPPAPVAPAPTPPPTPPTSAAPPPAPTVSTSPPPAPPSPAPDVPAQPPTYPDDFVGGPRLDTTDGEHAAGTASVIKLKGGTQSYILSARHLLGPDGGVAKQTAAEGVPAFVKRITIHAFSGGTRSYDVTGLLVPAKQLQPIGSKEPIDDLAVYLNKDASAQSQAVALADTVPPVGAPVWVVAHVAGGVSEGQVMQPAHVIFNTKWLVIQFDNDNIVTAGASGGPVLNAAGEVVGVYSGHAKDGTHMRGYIVPAPLIADVINKSASPTSGH